MPSREPSLSSTTAFNNESLQLLESINDQAVFYSGRQHGKHLDLLLHLSRYSNLLLTVTGPTGSGKTHLKNKLIEQLDSGVVPLSLDGRKVAQGPQLLARLENDLRLEIPPRADPQQYLEEIRDYTAQLSDDGGSCLLLIDQAEALEQSALDVVLELATTEDDNRRPHIALFGQNALLQKLNDHANLPRFEAVGHQLPLEAFGEVEARGYLEHRCHSVGLDHLPLDDNQFHRVYKAAKGWPGLLNQALLAELKANGPAEDTLPDEPEEPEAMPQPKTEAKPKKQKTSKRKKKAGSFKGITLNKVQIAALAGGALALALIVVGFLYVGDSQDAGVSSTATGLIDRSQQLRQGVQEGPRGTGEEVIEQLEKKVEEMPPLEEELARETSQPEPVPDAPPSQPQQPEQPDSSPPAATASSEPEPQTRPAETAAGGLQNQGSRRESWLMQRDPEHFALQLLASAEEATITSFIADQENPENFTYYRRDHASSPWVLVYGNYTDRAAAEAARDALPERLRNQNPWLRRFSGIQSDLNNR